MCLAIMACVVCRKKVLMENPLNVLMGIWGNLGDFAKVSASILCENTCFDKAARSGGHTPDMIAIRQADDVHLKIKLAKMSAGILNRTMPVCRLNTK